MDNGESARTNEQMKDIFPIGPNDKMIVLNEDNLVLFTDFSHEPLPPEARARFRDESEKKPHLLEIIGPNNQDILRLVGIAIDRPGKIVECDTTFRSEQKRVRVLHVALGGKQRRTQIVFEPTRK